jgi:ferric-dicitrate binding protein FerR (iron transport regulator)
METNYFLNKSSSDLSPEELKELENLNELKEWASASPENEENFSKIRKAWLTPINASEERRIKDEAYKRFLKRVGKHDERRIGKPPWQTLWKSAAAIALLIAASLVAYQLGSKPESAWPTLRQLVDRTFRK